MISARSAGLRRSIAIRLALAVAGSVFLAASAQVAVPMVPVPITLQTLAIPLLVLAIGRDLATLATFAYLAEGAAGVPVFALHSGGVGVLAGPTAGYLWMYPVAAYIIGSLCEGERFGTTYVGRWLAIFTGTAVVFAGGVWWLAVGFHLSIAHAFAAGVVPFVIGDLLKTTIAAGPASRARALLARLGA
jgi:biotin transport system substrate-specific component